MRLCSTTVCGAWLLVTSVFRSLPLAELHTSRITRFQRCFVPSACQNAVRVHQRLCQQRTGKAHVLRVQAARTRSNWLGPMLKSDKNQPKIDPKTRNLLFKIHPIWQRWKNISDIHIILLGIGGKVETGLSSCKQGFRDFKINAVFPHYYSILQF